MASAWIGAEDDCFLGFRLEGSHGFLWRRFMIKSFYVAWEATLSEWANLRSEPTLNYTEEQRKEHKKALEQCQDELAKILLPNTSFKDMPNSDRLLKRALEIALSYYDERFSSPQMVFELVEDIAEYVKYSFALLGKKG